MTRILAVIAVALIGCGTTDRADVRSTHGPASSPEEIATRFLEARRDGRVRVTWDCFAGTPDAKRIYVGSDVKRSYRTFAQFEVDFDFGWENPPLAPADAWELTESWEDDRIVVMVYRQGTTERPDRGSIQIRARPVGGGWMIEAVGSR